MPENPDRPNERGWPDYEKTRGLQPVGMNSVYAIHLWHVTKKINEFIFEVEIEMIYRWFNVCVLVGYRNEDFCPLYGVPIAFFFQIMEYPGYDECDVAIRMQLKSMK